MQELQKNDATNTRATARQALRLLTKVLDNPSKPEDIELVIEETEETIRLPRDVANLLREILVNTAAGQAVSIIPMSAELTTQQAADLLNVSRPHVVKLMDEGILKGHKVGTHRRLYASAVHTFKHQRDTEQRAAADELVALSEDLGLYE